MFAVAFVAGYLLGSLPTAYLFVKWKYNLDIRNEGSGNVGTLNSFEVTRSKSVGIAVLALDLLKGVAAALVCTLMDGGQFLSVAAGGIGVIVGHNYPVWLKFKGGRGLAPAAGVMFVIGWPFIAVWGFFWTLGYAVWREVNIGNVTATLLLLLFVIAAPDQLVAGVVYSHIPVGGFRYFGVIFLILILAKLIDPVMTHIREKRKGEHEPAP